MGFFDGAAATCMGGVGVHIILRKDHYFLLKLGCGQSTNTRFEILALWVLLVFAKHIGIPYLHIRGDSSAIINLVQWNGYIENTGPGWLVY